MSIPEPDSFLSGWIGRWNQFSRHVRRELGTRYSAIDLSEAKAVLLEALAIDQPERTQSELARDLHLPESSLCGLIEQMRCEGFLQRERSWKDRRKSVLTLTASGQERLRELHEIHRDVEADLLACLPSDLQCRITGVLEELSRIPFQSAHPPSERRAA